MDMAARERSRRHSAARVPVRNRPQRRCTRDRHYVFNDGTPEPLKAARRRRCGKCEGCLAEECGECKNCLDMRRHGGLGKRNQACKLRQCEFLKKFKKAETSDEETASESDSQVTEQVGSDSETEIPEGTDQDSEEDSPINRGRRRNSILPSSEDEESAEETPPIEIPESMSHDAIARSETSNTLLEKDEDIESIEAQLKKLREKHVQALHGKDIRIKRTEEQLKKLREKHVQALHEKDTRIKRTEEQLKKLREKHVQVLQEKDIRIERTEEQLKECKTWLQTLLENAPPCMKTWDKERDGE